MGRGLDEKISSWIGEFDPLAGFGSAHLQTLWGTLTQRRIPSLGFEEEILETPDGDHLALHHLPGVDDLPRLLVLHGLEGSHRSPSVTSLAWPFYMAGWPVTVMEYRSCSHLPICRPRLYHLGETRDLGVVVDSLAKRGPLCAAGISLGGNVLAKWLGEKGSRVPREFLAGAVLCPPFEPLVSGPQIDEVGAGLYSWNFLRTLKPKALEVVRLFPGSLDRAKVQSARTLYEFDSHATAPLHGFESAEHYWASSGCSGFLGAIRRPLLLLAAADDPFNPLETFPDTIMAQSPWLYGGLTPKGGHVGFVDSPVAAPVRWWPATVILRFLSAVAGGENQGGDSTGSTEDDPDE